MGRNEVLENTQPLAKVRCDGSLYDGTIRFGHQATHAGKLADLGSRTTGSRIRHHEDGVEGFLLDRIAVLVCHIFPGDTFHHGLGNLFICARPDVDDFIVSLTLSHQTRGILLIDLDEFLLGLLQDVFLFLGYDHVVHTDGNTGKRGMTETQVHQLISKNDCFLKASLAITIIQNCRNGLFGHDPVDGLVGQGLRQDIQKQGPAHGRFHERRCLASLLRLVHSICGQT